MIVFTLAAILATAQPVAAPPAPPPAPAAAPDPARMTAARHLLDAIHIDEQYDQIFSKLIPLMSLQIFTSLKDNVTVPPKLRVYLSDSANAATATRVFSDEATKSFRAHYPGMREATAQEYARIFTADELTGLTAFYATPLGQKALASLPELQNKLMPIGMAAGGEAGREAMLRMVERLGLDREPRSKS